jgi:uncharacterized protein (TIGR02646 family)
MKYIRKGARPRAYVNWCQAVADTDNADFREVSGPAKESLLSALISEQGSLCAYTMRRINQDISHVEHIKPYSACRADEPRTDLDYGNLVACFPRDGMKVQFRYGAQQKADWWENGGADFVSPLHPVCEKRFRFDLEGKIAAVAGNRAAKTTICVLALCHGSLTDDRKRVIEEFIYGQTGDTPLSLAQATQAGAAVCRRDGDGNFYEFCIAIRHALEEYLRVLRRRAHRIKAARRRR